MTIMPQTANGSLMLATLAGGCYWCTDAVFRRVKGVQNVQSGFTGGHVPNPNYHEVMSGRTGHIESVQISFDPRQISYPKILEVFFATHDPTSFDRQGYDTGPMYRSVVFWHNREQLETANDMIDKLNGSGLYGGKIVTELREASDFNPVSDDQQDFYGKNTQASYCQIIIDPKLRKLWKDFANLAQESN